MEAELLSTNACCCCWCWWLRWWEWVLLMLPPPPLKRKSLGDWKKTAAAGGGLRADTTFSLLLLLLLLLLVLLILLLLLLVQLLVILGISIRVWNQTRHSHLLLPAPIDTGALVSRGGHLVVSRVLKWRGFEADPFGLEQSLKGVSVGARDRVLYCIAYVCGVFMCEGGGA